MSIIFENVGSLEVYSGVGNNDERKEKENKKLSVN